MLYVTQEGKTTISHPPPAVTESSTEEELALATSFKKQRFAALIVKSVYLGLMLLAMLFALFVPCFQGKLKEEYCDKRAYTISVSATEAALGYHSFFDLLKQEAEEFEKNGGRVLLEEKIIASQGQILSDVAYKKGQSPNAFIRFANVDRILSLFEINVDAELSKIYASHQLTETEKEVYCTALKASLKTSTEALLIQFSYELERYNIAGLKEFITSCYNTTEKSALDKAAATYLLGTYEWTEEAIADLKEAEAAATFLPDYNKLFYLNSSKEIVSRYQMYASSGAFVFGLGVIATCACTFIMLIISAIFLYREFKNCNAPLRYTYTCPGAICAAGFIFAYGSVSSSLLVSNVGAAAIFSLVFLILASCGELLFVEIMYKKYKHIMHSRKKKSIK